MLAWRCRSTYNDISNIMAALFITMTFLGTSNSSGVQPIVSIERPVFYRERAAGAQPALQWTLRGLNLAKQRWCWLYEPLRHRIG